MNVTVTRKSELTGHTAAVYALAFSQGRIISAGSDRMIVAWDDDGIGNVIAKSNDVIFSLKEHKNMILCGDGSGVLYAIDPLQMQVIKAIQLHDAGIFAIASAGKNILTAGGDGSVCLLSDSYELLLKVVISDTKVRCIQFTGSDVIAGDSNGIVYVLNAGTLAVKHQWQAHESGFGVNVIVKMPESGNLISGSRDGHINIYNSKSFDLIKSLPAHKGAVYDVVFIHSQLFATASRDKSVKLWDASTFSVIAKLDEAAGGHHYSVNRLATANGELYSTGDDRKILCWQIKV